MVVFFRKCTTNHQHLVSRVQPGLRPGLNASPPEQRLHSADDVSQVKGQRHAGVVRAPEGPVHRGLLGGQRLGQTGVAPKATGHRKQAHPLAPPPLHHCSGTVGTVGCTVTEGLEQQQKFVSSNSGLQYETTVRPAGITVILHCPECTAAGLADYFL